MNYKREPGRLIYTQQTSHIITEGIKHKDIKHLKELHSIQIQIYKCAQGEMRTTSSMTCSLYIAWTQFVQSAHTASE